jgi:hypothetical protein
MIRGPHTIDTAPDLTDTSFRLYSWFPQEKLLVSSWKPESIDLDEGSFKAESLHLAALIRKHKPSLLLLDNARLRYPIPTELQEWYAGLLQEVWQPSPIDKIALVFDHDLLVNLSIEMIGHYAVQMGLRSVGYRAFSDADTAKKWLLSF